MIKGNRRKDYNDFEEEILTIVGSIRERYGLEFFCEHINQTFDIAEKAVLLNSEEYKAWYKREDFETQESIYHYDTGFQINTTPLTEVLRTANFITIHSEFENTWKEIFRIHNQFLPKREFSSLNDKFLTNNHSNPTCVLDKVVGANKILISYNYLRNKIVHQNALTISPEYSDLKEYVESGEIEHLKIKEVDNKVTFTIISNKLIRNYTQRIIKFITDIATKSYYDRKSI